MRSAAMALAWKEWREQRPIVAAALLLAAIMPFFLIAVLSTTRRGIDPQEMAQILPIVLYLLVCPLFAAAVGGATIANEIGEGTIGYLLSRPMSRSRVWAVKVLVGGAAAAVVLAGSALVTLLAGMAAGAEDWSLVPRRLGEAGAPWMVMAAVMSAPALFFCASVFFSTFLSRAMNAAAAGLALSILLLGGIVLIWSRLDLVPRLEPGLFLLEILLAGGVSLLASLFLFRRGEMLAGRAGRLRALLAGTAALGVVAILSVPAIRAAVSLTPATATVAEIVPTPAGDEIFLTVMAPEGLSPEIWGVHADGTGIERPTGRLTFAPAVSPDGGRLAYLSQRGSLGLRSDRVELRLMRRDGGADLPIATDLDVSWRFLGGSATSFSPDGSHVALCSGTTLTIAPVDHGRVVSVPLSGTALEGGRIAGWSADGGEVLLIKDTTRDPHGSIRLGAVGSATGAIRTIHERPSARAFAPLLEPGPRGWRKIPLFVDPGSAGSMGLDLVLVDVATGEAERVAGGVRGLAADLSSDERQIVLSTRSEAPGGEDDSDLRWIDRAAGTDLRVATLEGRIWSVQLSPAGDRVLVHRFHPNNSAFPAAVVGRDGTVRELAPGWAPLGWQGRDRVLLGTASPPGQLAVADLPSGALRVFYP